MKTARFSTWGMALGLLLAVVLHAPAQWLASGVNAASRGHVQLRDAQGTVWQGHAQWVLTSGPGGQDALALPQRLHWQLRPQWNGLQLTLNAACCTPQPVLLQLQPVWLGLQVSLVSPRMHFSNNNHAGSGIFLGSFVFLSTTGRPLASKIPSTVISSSVIPLYCFTFAASNCTKSVSLLITMCSSWGCRAIQRAIMSSPSAVGHRITLQLVLSDKYLVKLSYVSQNILSSSASVSVSAARATARFAL